MFGRYVAFDEIIVEYLKIIEKRVDAIYEYINNINKDLCKIEVINRELIQMDEKIANKMKDHQELEKQYSTFFKYTCLNDICLEIANRSIESQNDIHFESIDEIIPLEMPGNNPRIDAQNGLFLFPKRFLPIEDALCMNFIIKKDSINETTILRGKGSFEEHVNELQMACIIKIIFDYSFSELSRKMLENANVNAKNLFPDETGIAQSIEYW